MALGSVFGGFSGAFSVAFILSAVAAAPEEVSEAQTGCNCTLMFNVGSVALFVIPSAILTKISIYLSAGITALTLVALLVI